MAVPMADLESMSKKPEAFHAPKRTHPYLKRVLVPFWTLQLLFQLACCGFGIRSARDVTTPYTILLILITITNIILIITETLLQCARQLKEVTFLVMQVVKTALWIIVFAIQFADTRRVLVGRDRERVPIYENVSAVSLIRYHGRWDAMSVVMAVLLGINGMALLLFLGLLIYASVIYHRHRRAKMRQYRQSSRIVGERSTAPHSSPLKPPNTKIQSPNANSRSPTNLHHLSHPYHAHNQKTSLNQSHLAFRKYDNAGHERWGPAGTAAPPYAVAEVTASQERRELAASEVAEADVGHTFYEPHSPTHRNTIKQLEGDESVHELPTVRSMKSLPRLPRRAYSGSKEDVGARRA